MCTNQFIYGVDASTMVIHDGTPPGTDTTPNALATTNRSSAEEESPAIA